MPLSGRLGLNCCGAALLCVCASGASGQVVVVELREARAGAPVAGALLSLVADGKSAPSVVEALSGGNGRARLTAREPGTYRVQVKRIGYRPVLSEPMVLEAGAVKVTRMDLTAVPIVLPTAVVQVKALCESQISDGPAAVVWEEIRAALAATTLTEQENYLRLRISLFKREATLAGDTSSRLVTKTFIATGTPFMTIAPETLTIRGFVFQSGRDLSFAAPDARLIVSEWFVHSHCFQLVRPPDPDTSMLGLHFEPAAKTRLVDINGTMWIDRNAHTLQYLEFSYAGLAGNLSRAKLGGRLDFRHLAAGEWFVSNWYVRMPRMAVTPASEAKGWTGEAETSHIVGYIDQGGRADLASTRDLLPFALVSGTVYDSTTMSFLSGAVVRFANQRDSAVTDSSGRFTIRSDSGGWQTLVASHPKLGLLPDSYSTTGSVVARRFILRLRGRSV